MSESREMPFAVGPEKAVVSVLMQYPEKIDEVPNLTPAHFHIPAPRIVFSEIQEMAAKGIPIELVSFTERLRTKGRLDMAGGPAALADLYTYSPSPAHLDHHAAMLGEMLARRMAITAAAEIARTAYEAPEVGELIEVTSQPISDIHDVLTGNRPVESTKAVIEDCMNRWRGLCSGTASPMGIETSLHEINQRFNGLHVQQTVVISAYPAGGKTSLAGQFAMDAATAGHNTLVCSLEMPARDLMNRMIAYVARVHGIAITDPRKYCDEVLGKPGSIPPREVVQNIQRAALAIRKSPFSIEDLRGANVQVIAACIRRGHRKSPLKLVVVDYAQRIRPISDNSKQNREQQLSHASNHLSDLAKELGFCLILPSQLNKEGAAKHAEAINEDADLHLRIIQNTDKTSADYKAHLGIAVDKDRHHGHDGVLLPIVFDGPRFRFIPKPFTT